MTSRPLPLFALDNAMLLGGARVCVSQWTTTSSWRRGTRREKEREREGDISSERSSSSRQPVTLHRIQGWSLKLRVVPNLPHPLYTPYVAYPRTETTWGSFNPQQDPIFPTRGSQSFSGFTHDQTAVELNRVRKSPSEIQNLCKSR